MPWVWVIAIFTLGTFSYDAAVQVDKAVLTQTQAALAELPPLGQYIVLHHAKEIVAYERHHAVAFLDDASIGLRPGHDTTGGDLAHEVGHLLCQCRNEGYANEVERLLTRWDIGGSIEYIVR